MIHQRNLHRIEFEKSLERFSPTKVKLIKANPLTCPTCLTRGSVALTCTGGCNGTGYTGMAKITKSTDWLNPPASSTFFVYADIQIGKGRFGTGGDYIKLDPDFGKLSVGDATAFMKFEEFDRRSGTLVYADVTEDKVRPDRIIDRFGTLYTIHEAAIVNLGDDPIGRVFTLTRGIQSGTA
jgi:hypothetical protein